MKVLKLETTDLSLPEMAKLAKDGPIIFTRKGKPVLAVRDLSKSDWESLALAENPRFQALIEESRRSYQEHGGIHSEQLRKELNLKPFQRRPNGGRKKIK